MGAVCPERRQEKNHRRLGREFVLPGTWHGGILPLVGTGMVMTRPYIGLSRAEGSMKKRTIKSFVSRRFNEKTNHQVVFIHTFEGNRLRNGRGKKHRFKFQSSAPFRRKIRKRKFGMTKSHSCNWTPATCYQMLPVRVPILLGRSMRRGE